MNSDRIENWYSQTNSLLDELSESSYPYLFKEANSVISELHLWLLSWLSISCEMTSASVITLIKNGMLWDAEVLMRSIVEGTVKFVYLSYGKEHELQAKLTEYWNILPETARLRRHKNIRNFFQLIDESDQPEWKPLMDQLLTDQEVEIIETKYSKKTRHQIEQRWSLSELIRSLSSSGIQGFESFVALVYGYSVASHHVHKDGDSTGIIWDRERREEPRKRALILAHTARLFSDTATFARIRTFMVLRLNNVNRKQISILEAKYQPLFDDFTRAIEEWQIIEYGNL